MTDKQIIEAMARLDGYTDEDERTDGWWSKGKYMIKDDKLVPKHKIPPYLTSHDAVQRVIDGLSDNGLAIYYTALFRMLNCRTLGERQVAIATPRQKCEVILKALGKEV